MKDSIKMVKLVSGETVMGVIDKERGGMKDIVLIQAIPAQSGQIQLALIPYSYPYDSEIGGFIKDEHIIYIYNKTDDTLKDKYIEAKSSIRIASSMSQLDNGGGNILL